jgi:chitodextrinase
MTCDASHHCVSTGTQSPYQTVNVNSAPVTIQAENYDLGGEGVAYHDTTSGNNWPGTFRSDGVDIQPTTDTDLGYNIGSTAAGEWLEYTVNVQTAAAYTFDLRLANNNSGTTPTVKVYVDGTLAGSTTQGYTGGWQTWATASVAGPSLTTGTKVIKIELTNGGLNFNWFKMRQTSDTTAPTNPGSPTTSGVTASQATLSWTASTDAVGVTGYRVYRNGLQVGTATGTSYTVTGLQPDSTYVLGVSAFDAAGNNSSTVNAANVTTSPSCSGVRVYQNSAYGGYGVCLQTGDYNAAALLARGIKDNDITSVKVLTGYTLTMYDLDAFTMSTGSALVKTVDDSTLTDDVLGAGSWNDKVSSLKVTTVGADTQAPTVPTALTIGTVSTTQIPLSWTASTDNVNVTGYDLYRNGTLVASVGGTTYNYTFTGLTTATGYTLGVRAKDGSNNFSTIATKAATTAGSTAGNCSSLAWSGTTNYSIGSIVKEPCAWNILCSAGDLNLNFAWRCDSDPATGYCKSTRPGASGSNWTGIWTKLETCP